MSGNARAERAWTWLCRGLAVVGFVYLLVTVGFEAPWGAFLLLLGLFFGPEVVKGQIQINGGGGRKGGE